jgi:hypothetical protein
LKTNRSRKRRARGDSNSRPSAYMTDAPGAPGAGLAPGRFDFAFFLFVLLPPAPFTPPLLPFNPQFSPFTANHLTYPYWHASIPHVCLHSASKCPYCLLRENRARGLSSHVSSLFFFCPSCHSTHLFSNAYGLFRTMERRNPRVFIRFRTLPIAMGVYTPSRSSTLSAHNRTNRTPLPLPSVGSILKVT